MVVWSGKMVSHNLNLADYHANSVLAPSDVRVSRDVSSYHGILINQRVGSDSVSRCQTYVSANPHSILYYGGQKPSDFRFRCAMSASCN